MKARRLDALDRRNIIALTIMRKPSVTTLERVVNRQTFCKSFLLLPVADSAESLLRFLVSWPVLVVNVQLPQHRSSAAALETMIGRG